jgi:hypothetical protein
MAADHTVTAAPALGWRQTVTFGPRDAAGNGTRILESSFHIPVDMPVSTINAYLDRVSRCIDRQIAYYELQDAETQVAALRVKLSASAATIVEVQARSEAAWEAQANRRGEWNTDRMSVQDRQALAGAEATLDRDRNLYEFWSKRVAELTEVVNQDAVERRPDRDPSGPEG